MPGLSRWRSGPMPRAASMRGSAALASASAMSVKETKRRPADISTRTPTTPRTFDRQHQQRSVMVRTRALVSHTAPSNSSVVSDVVPKRHRAIGPPQTSMPIASAGWWRSLSAMEALHRSRGQSSTKAAVGACSDAHARPRLGDHQPVGDPGGRERGAQVVGALREVRPALEVHRDDGAGTEDLGCLRGGVGRERQVGAVEALRHADRAAEEDRELDRARALGDRAHDVDRGVVAADVERRRLVGGEHEADHRPRDRVAALGTVQGGNGGDRDRAGVGALEREGVPRREADGVAAQAPGPIRRGQRAPGARQERAPAGVEVVGVMVVGEQDRVDGADVVRAHGGPGELGQTPGVLAGRVEGRVGEQAQARVVEHRGGAADEAHGERGGHRLILAPGLAGRPLASLPTVSSPIAAAGPLVERDSIVLRLADPDAALAGVRLATDRGFPVAAEPFAREADGWTLRIPAPPLDRFEYALAVQRADGGDEQWTDPANPLRAPGAFGEKSVVQLPGYSPPAWLDAERVPGAGERLTVASSALGAELEVVIWRPHDAHDGEPLPQFVAHDGPELDELARLTDYSAAHIASGALPRHRVALVAPGDRDQWYSASALYARALA